MMFPWGARATHHHHTFEPGGAPRDWRSPWRARATHHHHTLEPGGAPRDWRSPWWARATLHHHTFEPGGAPRDEGPHGGRVPLSTRSTLSGAPHEGHWWFACHAPPPPTMLAHDGCAPFTGTLRLRLAYLCHASSPDVHTRFALAMLARLSGCLCSGSRFSHLSSGDSRFIVCNAQCPFLKDGLKWIVVKLVRHGGP